MADTKTGNTVEKSNKNEKVGHVVANKMAKTIVVEVTRRVAHPLYKRIVSKRKKFYAHDEEGQANVGDVVRIIECRPMSKLKRWRLGEVMRKAVQVTTDPALSASSPGRNGGPRQRKRRRVKAPPGRKERTI
jgi:small subunit ribosomal protein S17